MSEHLTRETFAPLVGETFDAQPAEGPPLRMVLANCGSGPHEPGEGWEGKLAREPFELIFDAESDGDDFPPQQTFILRHDRLGEHDVFLVPIGRHDSGVRYQAVFS